MSIPVPDPFMAPVARRPGDFERTSQGVPLVADPDGTLTKPKNKRDPGHVKKLMYRRPSGFGKQIENTYNLQKWGERQQALGFALDFNLLKDAVALLDGDRDSKEWKAQADEVVVAAKTAAKAWIAAERGTHTHGLTEDDDSDVDIVTRLEAGEELGLASDVQHALVQAWRTMLADNGLEVVAVEFAMVNDHYRAAGTGDRIARLTRPLKFRLCTGELVDLAAGAHIVLDIKTGQRRLDGKGVVMYWQSYAVQVALYAGGQLYDPDTDLRTPYPWPVDQSWALIAHLDVLGAIDGTPSCELVAVDLAAGRRAADLCVAARDWENEASVFSVAQVVVEEEKASQQLPSNSAATDAGEEPLSSPALTPVRPHLERNPDPGADLTNETALWQTLEATFHGLDDAARAWCGRLIKDSIKHNVSFRAREQRSVRSFELYRGLIALCVAGLDTDGVLRALCALVAGETALWPSVAPGHLLGSLGATQAARFAHLVDALCAEQLHSYVDTDGTLRYSEPVTA